jgi:glycosyltransferase involved in cell wall biosynthesis
LESLHNQAYPNLEHIVIDGGSRDASIAIIESYSNRIQYWISEPDGGQADALIKGFARATGEILCWLCSDDLLERGALLEVAEFFQRNPEAEIVYGDSTWIDAAGKHVRPKKEHSFSRFIWLHDHNFIPQPSTFWRRRLYDRVGGLDPSYRVAMDGDLWLRFSDVTRLHHVRRMWSRMRWYPEQMVQRLRPEVLLADERMRDRYLGSQSKLLRRLKWALARSVRISWKLATGCYWG